MKSKSKINFDGACICTGNTTWASLALKREKRAWYDAYIGRQIMPVIYEEHFGRGGWQPEFDYYTEKGVFLCICPKVDTDGYIKEITETKFREIGYSPRPQTEFVRVTKDDIRRFKEYLEPLLVPLSEPGARKTVPNVMPEGWTASSLKEGYEALCDAVKKGDLAAVRKLREYACVIVPECDNVDSHPFILAAKKKNLPILKELYAGGAYLFDTCFVRGKGHVSALSASIQSKSAAVLSFLLDHGALAESGTGEWDYGVAGVGYSYQVIEDLQSRELFDVVWDHLSDKTLRITLPRTVGVAELMDLVARNSKALFRWTPKLYRACMTKAHKFIECALKKGEVDLAPEFFVENDDLKGFRLKMESYLRPEVDMRDVPALPASVWRKSKEWEDLAIRLLMKTKKTPEGAERVWSASNAIHDLFGRGRYSACLKLLDLDKGVLDDCVFYGDAEFPKGDESHLAREVIEVLYARHPKGENEYWSEEFVSNFLAHASDSMIKRAVKKTPLMLSSSRGKPTSMLCEAASHCEEVAASRSPAVFAAVVKAAIPCCCRKWTEYIEISRKKFLKDLKRRIEFRVTMIEGGCDSGSIDRCRKALDVLKSCCDVR